jgi:hypothetical protein
MTYPNPAGYYLPLPEAIESEITKLDYVELSEILNAITYSLVPDGDAAVITDCLACQADEYITSLDPEPRIALIRWISERLAYLARCTNAKP